MAERRRSGKLAVILHADIAGSTALVQQDEDVAHERIQDSFRRFSETITQYHGHVRELRGDALLAEFERASDAIPAALAFLADQAEYTAQLNDPIRPTVRVGIAMGEVVVADNTVTGAGVVLAQRVEQLAEPEGVCITGAIREALPQRMPFIQANLGEQQVKGFDEPVHVYRVELKPGESIPPPQEYDKREGLLKRLGRIAAVVAIVLVIAGGAVYWFKPWTPEEEPASVERMAFPLPDKPSIAVLAFDNLSGDPTQEYLSDGISESIITGLSHFPEFFVVARQSAFSYKGKAFKVQQVAEELGIQYILEGSVQRSDDKVRVTAQLIDAVTGHHLWAERYDREWEDIFALQDDITQQVVATISSDEGPIEKAMRQRAKQKAPADLRAYDYFLLGRVSFFRVTKEDNVKARELFQKATQLDPNYSLAHVWIAWTHLLDFTWGWSDTPVLSADLAFDHAQKAVALDTTTADGHWVLGSVLINIRGQPKAGLAEYDQALVLNPNNADLIAEYGWALPRLGRAEEGIEFIEKAMRLNPVYPDWYRQALMFALYIAKRYPEVIAVADTLKVRLVDTYLVLVGSHAQLGQLDDAHELAAKVMEMKPDFSLQTWREIQVFARHADLEHYIDGLQKAGLPEDPPLKLPDKPSIAVLPFTNMSDDPEQEYFVDGMTEDLITDLSKIPGLFVIARNSSFTYKGKAVDVKHVARDLGVRYVMEGSVRRAGNQVRINAQLIDTTTGGHLWTERYDGSLTDVFALQDKVTQNIVAALAVTLSTDDQAHQLGQETDNYQAYDALLRGWEHYRRQNREDYEEATKHLERAISLDPEYSRAYAVLAEVHRHSAYLGWYLGDVSPARSLERAKRYLREAMRQPTPLAHQVAAKMLAREGRYSESVTEAKRAVALDANDPAGHMAIAEIMLWVGAPDRALSHIEAAIRLNPFFPADYLFLLGLAEFNLEQFDEAIVTLERAVDRNPSHYPQWTALVSAQGHLGRNQDAQLSIERANEQRTNAGRAPLSLAVVDFWRFKDPADAARFQEGLRKAGVPDLPFNYDGHAENKLDGEEIRDLLFGHTYSGQDPNSGSEWRTAIESDGRATTEAPWYSGSQVRWIEDGMLCHRSEGSAPESRVCGFIFRNPEGTRQKRDEYHWVGGPGVYPFSLVD